MLPGRDSCPLFLPKKPVFSSREIPESSDVQSGSRKGVVHRILLPSRANSEQFVQMEQTGKSPFFIVSCNPFSLQGGWACVHLPHTAAPPARHNKDAA